MIASKSHRNLTSPDALELSHSLKRGESTPQPSTRSQPSATSPRNATRTEAELEVHGSIFEGEMASLGPIGKREQEQEAIRNRLRHEIDFIPNERFSSRKTERELLAEHERLFEGAIDANPTSDVPADLPSHLARLCEIRLLTPEQESHLFCYMNFLKYRANSIRVTLKPERLNRKRFNEMIEYHDAAMEIRNRIVRANMRLVISIVKKFVTPQISFDDLLSEGIETVMNAVDKFDFDRGFRFSTYAYRSIARNAFRVVSDRQKEMSRFHSGGDDSSFENFTDDGNSVLNERVWDNLRTLLARFMDHLDRREQFIIRGRYALGAHRKVRSFQCLADKLGISKERVRQLESRAVGKLKALANEHGSENLVETLAIA